MAVKRYLILLPPSQIQEANGFMGYLNREGGQDSFPSIELFDSNGNLRYYMIDYVPTRSELQKASSAKGGKRDRDLLDVLEKQFPGSKIWTVAKDLIFDTIKKESSDVTGILSHLTLHRKKSEI